MIDWTKPVRMKEEKGKVEIFCTDLSGKYPVLGVVVSPDGRKREYTWTKDGRFNIASVGGYLDLENIPEEREFWVNLYLDTDMNCCHPTRKIADEQAGSSRRGCIKVKYQLGQFDK